MNWDILRFICMFLYVFLVVQTLGTLFYYHQIRVMAPKAKGLLTSHIMLVSFVLIGLATEAVYVNFERLGHGFTWYAPINAILFGAGNVAIFIVNNYEHRRYGSLKLGGMPPKE